MSTTTAFRVRCAVIVDEPVAATGRAGEPCERALDHARYREHVRVAGFARLEEDVGVLRAAAQHRSIRVEPAQAVRHDPVVVDERGDHLGVGNVDASDLVTGAKAVEEVQEGDARFERGRMRNEREVGGLLRRRRAQHRPARRPRRHHVAVITEDRQRMRRDGTSGNMDDRRRELARDLEHVREHQQQALARGERRGERAAGGRTVERARRARLRLHLDDLGHRAPPVDRAVGGERVGQLPHRRRRRDRIQRDHLGQGVHDSVRGFVAIDDRVRHTPRLADRSARRQGPLARSRRATVIHGPSPQTTNPCEPLSGQAAGSTLST